MAKTTDPQDFPDEWEYETVSTDFPNRVVFDRIGDEFIGLYKGTEKVSPSNPDDKPFRMYNFEGRDGQPYAVSDYTRLRKAMESVRPGKWVRIRYVADIPTSQDNPMMDFVVDVRK